MGTIASYIVAIPAYNEAATILQTLDSVYEASLKTSAQLKTIIVCVNGCTDATEELLHTWKKVPLVILTSQPGLVHAMNRLIAYAHEHHKKDAFIKVDGDSILDPQAFGVLFAQLAKHPKLMIAGGHPYPIVNTSLSIWKQFVSKITSVRGRVPLAEVAVKDVARYHQYTAKDPLPDIGEREEKLKIYIHGRLWCMRVAGELPLLPSDAIGEDVFLPGWALNKYGPASMRIDYRATVRFRPNDSLSRHWKVYRRIHEDRHRIYTTPGFVEYAAHCPLKLDWLYIITKAPKREIGYFVLYAMLVQIERATFRVTTYRSSYWQYQEKET